MPLTSEKAREVGKLGGRPKGSKLPVTLEKEKALQEFKFRVAKMADKLLNAQAIQALGTHKIIVMSKDADGKMHVETVRDETRMQNLLDTGKYGVDYLVVAGAEPDWKAASALLDRTFGKAKESIDISGEIKFSLRGIAERRAALKAKVYDVTPKFKKQG